VLLCPEAQLRARNLRPHLVPNSAVRAVPSVLYSSVLDSHRSACPLLCYKQLLCLQACTTGCACARSDAAGAGPSSAAANAARAGGAANLNAGQSAAAARLFEKVQVLLSCCWHR